MLIHRLLFYLFNVASFFLFNLHKIVWLRPQSVHQWRQCDSAAYCLKYFENPDSNFFFPQVMFQWAYKGYVISEFPIIYWISGKLGKLFGYHEAIPRMVTYFVFILGLIFLFELGLRLFKNKWFAFIPVLIIYSSPVLVYYALNYLPNVPGLALTLVSWYFFFRYITSRKINDFIWCSAIAMLAALLKPIEIFNYLIMFGILFLEYFNLLGLKKHSYSSKELKTILIAFVSVIIVNYLWVLYARGYAQSFGYEGNLLGILPIWNMQPYQITDTLIIFRDKWSYQLFWTMAHFVFLLLLIIVIVFHKKTNPYLFLALIFSIVGQIAYVILFFDVFYHHDYYMINIFIIPILTVIAIIQIWEAFDFKKMIAYPVYVLSAIFFFYLLKHSNHILHNRYYGFLQESIVSPQLKSITPYLRSIGVQKEDLVICAPDPSPNISLYLMNQSGWTTWGLWQKEQIDRYVNQGAKYLIVNKEITEHADWFTDLMKNPVGDYCGIKIYKIR